MINSLIVEARAVDVGFDPIAFLTSLFAVWFAYTESRKNNNVVVKILRCDHSGKSVPSENRGEMFHKFTLVIRNQGISLHDPRLTLDFNEKSGFETIHIPMKRREEQAGDHSEFSRGMIAEFSLKSYEIDSHLSNMLSRLEDVSVQDARFNLYSQGYLAKTFYVGRLANRLRVRWNRFAHRLNRKFDRRVGERGLKPGKIVPLATETSLPLRFFIQEARCKSPEATDKSSSPSPRP